MKTYYQPPPETYNGFWDAAAGGILPGLFGGVVMLVVLIAGGLQFYFPRYW